MADDFPLHQARSDFEYSRHHLATLKSDPKFGEYFDSESEFQEALKTFFSISDEDLERLYNLGYPLNGQIFFNHTVLVQVVKQLPELLLSILREGISWLITLFHYQDDHIHSSIPIDYGHLRQISEAIFFNWRTLSEVAVPSTDGKKNLQDLEAALNSLQFSTDHYDLLGCFQVNYVSQLLYIQCANIPVSIRSPRIGPRDSLKRQLLAEIVGFLAMPVKGADSIPLTNENLENFDQLLNDYLLGHNFLSGIHSELIPPVKLEASNAVEELDANYGLIDGLVLHLPEDQTTDQSLVYLDFLSAGKKVADIELSHMEAAFLYYLGAERQAEESYWLHEPENHKPTLQKIWKSFALPKHFETEVEITSPKEGSTSTWIWDFRNNNRKSWRNQIHKKIRVLRSDSLDFDLITRLPPKSPSRGGNYKLNTQITSFEIIKPSR